MDLKTLRNEAQKLITNNLKKIRTDTIPKFYQIAYNGQKNKLSTFIERMNEAIKGKKKITYATLFPSTKVIKPKVEKKEEKKKNNPLDINIDDGDVVYSKQAEKKEEKKKAKIVINENDKSTVNMTFWAELKDDEDAKRKTIYERKVEGKTKKLYKLKENYIFNALTDLVKTFPIGELFTKAFYEKHIYSDVVIDTLNDKDDKLSNFYANIRSALFAVEIVDVERIDITEVKKLTEVKYGDQRMKLFNEYLDIKTNKEAKEFKDLFDDAYNVEYLNNNVKTSACLYDAIIEQFKNDFDNYYKKTKLTYEFLYKFIKNGEYKEGSDMTLYLKEVLPFFKKYRLIIKAYDIQMNVIFKYHPEEDKKERNKHFNNYGLFIICHDNHIYRLNKDIKRLTHLEDEKTIELNIQSDYQIIEKQTYTHFINDINDLLNIDFEKINQDYLSIVYGGDMKQLYYKLIVDCKYKPRVSIRSGGTIAKLVIGINDKTLIISPVCASSVEPDFFINNNESYKVYHDLDYKLYKSVINKSNLSRYDSDFIKNLKLMMPKAMSCKLNDRLNKKSKIGCIDICKAYTHYLRSMPSFPVAKHFDNFMEYTGETIEDNNLYIVEKVKHATYGFNDKYTIILPQKQNLMKGSTLKYFYNEIKYYMNIKYVVSFSQYSKNNTKKIIGEIYNNEILNTYEKKFIVNKLTGLLEKGKNSCYKSWIFETANEAMIFRDKYGGEIYSFKLSAGLTNDEIKMMNELNKNIDDEKALPYLPEDKEPKKLYYVIKNLEKELTNGFMPIKAFIYDSLRCHMQKVYNKYSEKYNIIGITTDALYIEVDEDQEKEFNEMVEQTQREKKEDQYSYIGKVSFSWTDADNVPSKPIFVKDEVKLNIKEQPNINNVEIKDEYDSNEFKKKFEQYDKLLIEAIIPGAGKTTAIKNYIIKTGKRAIFVCPYNLQGYQMMVEGLEGMTLYALTGTILSDKFEEKIIDTEIDFNDYEYIVFDEIYCYKTSDLYKIKKFMLDHPKLRYVATGDTDQNKPINDTNVKSYKVYYKKIVYQLFKNIITLKINKRFESEEDKEKILNIKDDIFVHKLDIMDICKKYFKIIERYEDIQGFCISYFNKTNDMVNRYLHARSKPKGININGIIYYKDLHLVARAYLRLRKQRIRTNFTYIIIDIDEKKKIVITKCPLTKQLYEINYKILNKFSLPYGGTGHGVQGATVNKPITIFDVGSFGASREWFWTALTRTTKINNINIFMNTSKNMDYIKAKIQQKINNHLIYDKSKGYDTDNYVNIDWVLDTINENAATCAHCGNIYDVDYSAGSDTQFSINRIDNSKGHVKDNCNIICLHCNISNH